MDMHSNQGIGNALGIPTKCTQAFVACALLLTSLAYGQANGKLQIHFMDVGQGDGAVLISPRGEVVLFDNGVANNCDRPVSYLQQLGVTKIDYHIASHYHADHIGCAKEVLETFPLQKAALDRGHQYRSAAYDRYVRAVGAKRKTAIDSTVITLDSNTLHPVTIKSLALNGNGIATTNENDLSLVATIGFGDFDAEIGGDLSGYETSSYKDIETTVAPKVGQIEVYKVHHHGSSHSSNDTWLATVKPRIGIISAGDNNSYGHPTADCLERLHNAGVKTYWTEGGGGAEPEPGWDVVGGNIIVEVVPGSREFTVTRSQGGVTDRYLFWESTGSPDTPTDSPTYAWSKRSNVYHLSGCRYVTNISPGNLQQGPSPPSGKTLHMGCPK